MIRSFEVSGSRHGESLDGVWAIGCLPDDWDGTNVSEELCDDTLCVPSCWESRIQYSQFRGRMLYVRRFYPARVPVYRLVFEAVSHTATVYIDGQEVGRHYGAHTAFDIVLPGLSPDTHTLSVVVDNRFGPESTLHAPRNDWYTHGGIMRSVTLEHLPEVFIRAIRCVKQRIRKSAAEATAHVVVENRGAKAVEMPVELAFDDCEPLSRKVMLKPGENLVAFEVKIRKPRLWSPDAPQLYYMVARVGNDLLVDRTGLRTIEVAGAELLLNGEPIDLSGVNRHEFHPHFGQSLPPEIHLRDLDLIDKLGCDFIRGSHYPNDPLFLDLCDERGMMFWEEATAWQIDAELLNNPLFIEQQSQCIREMVLQHINHPSIVMWGMLNESHTQHESSVEPVSKLVKLTRELDPTRPVTFACNRIGACKCLHLFDILSFNLYPGWYRGDLDGIGKALDGIKDFIDSIEGLMPKPVLISEFGAGAVRGVRQAEALRWSEDYQALLLERFLGEIDERDWIKGFAIWQFCDARTDDSKFLQRPRSYNNKGLVDEFRQPKLAYERVRRHLEGRFDFSEELGELPGSMPPDLLEELAKTTAKYFKDQA